MEQKYIGIIEENEHEGETFGFYFPDTPENRESLLKFEALAQQLGEAYNKETGKYWKSSIQLDLMDDPCTKRELDMIDYGADNGYMPRANIVSEPELMLERLLKIDNFDYLPYKGWFESEGTRYRLV